MKIKIAPSIMCADFRRLEQEIKELQQAGADLFHFDIMDGHFVPNFTYGYQFVASLRGLTDLPFDVHLMIENPDMYIEKFIGAGSDIISVHAEACDNLAYTIDHIKSCGIKAAVGINPKTPVSSIGSVLDKLDMVLIMTVNPGFAGQAFIPEVVPKISELRNLITNRGLDIDIEVDGNIGPATVPRVVKAGANVLVGGTAGVFLKGRTYQDTIYMLRQTAEESLRIPMGSGK